MDKELEKLKGDVKIPFFKLIRRSLSYIKSEIWYFIVAFLLVLLTVGVNVALPILQGEFTNILKSESQEFSIIINILICYAALSVFNGIVVFIESLLLQNVGQKIVYRIRMEVFEHIENLSLNQLNEMSVGSLVTRVATYTTNMSNLFTNNLIQFIRNFLLIFAILGVMYFLNLPIALIMTALGIVVFTICYFFAKKLKQLFQIEHGYYSDMHKFLNENLQGMEIIEAYNVENKKIEDFNKINQGFRKARYNVVLLFATNRPLIRFIYYLSLALIFYLVTKNWLNAGTVVTMYMLFNNFFNPIERIADSLNEFQKAMTSSERLFNLMDVKPTLESKENALKIENFKGKIEFRHVWFSYDNQNWVLKDVSFVVNPKETVALVGATGSGKTTILSLIVKNYSIQKGEILIDDINIDNIEISSLRKAIGQMLQDVFLFTGTIRDNITLFDENFKDEELMSVCEYVGADKFVKSKKEKFDFEILESGVNVSQGEKQLLSFARTILAKPQMLILDEATANIDTETEVTIQNSLKKIKNIGTMIVVAHRLSTIQHSDKILVLYKGEIIEQGTHQELLKMKGYYNKLYQIQFKGN